MPLFRHPSPGRTAIHVFLGLLTALALCGAEPKAPPASPALPAATPSALDSDAQGWIDLLSQPDLRDWRRERFPATKPLGESNPWKLDAMAGILRCEGTGVHEMLLHRPARGDGIFHAEFRFVGPSAKPNSGLFVRTSPDAATWYQAQLTPTGLGMLFGQVTTGDAKPKRVSAGARYPGLMRPNGEWNVMEITCRGAEVTIWVNGHVTAQATSLVTPQGHIGLEAEFNPVEFRQLKFKPLP
ncbi:MAG: DUF1080 domain-containing protein [Opitutaceae bacterium]